jgi:hypothetical protein
MNDSQTAAKLEADDLLNLLGSSQANDFAERRCEVRHPFFAAVSLRTQDRDLPVCSAFSREISHSGIGLLHIMPLKAGVAAQLTITAGATKLQKSAEVIWCRPAGEGWYLSGWRFIAAT